MTESDVEMAQYLENYREQLNLPRWQLDLTQELLKFKLSLLGLVPNDNYGLSNKDGGIDTREFIPIPGASLVNNRGAIAIHNKLQSELTKIPSDSNFDEDVIIREIMAFDMDFPFWLAVNAGDFEVADNNYNSICESAVRLVKAAWYRSKGGWKGNLINNNTQQREVITNNQEFIEQRKPRLFGLGGK